MILIKYGLKAQVQNVLVLFVASGGRITKASNWICEAVFSYPEELPLERLDEYNDLIIKYMNARFNNNVVNIELYLSYSKNTDLTLMNMKKPKKRSRADCLQRNTRRKWSRKKKNLIKS